VMPALGMDETYLGAADSDKPHLFPIVKIWSKPAVGGWSTPSPPFSTRRDTAEVEGSCDEVPLVVSVGRAAAYLSSMRSL
jgi:hypothetical protein